MNIIPKQRFCDQPEKVFQREHFEIFSPLEYLDGNSLCDYMLEEPYTIKVHLGEDKIESDDV